MDRLFDNQTNVGYGLVLLIGGSTKIANTYLLDT